MEGVRKRGPIAQTEKVESWVFRIAKNADLTKSRKSVFAPSRESLDKFMPAKHPDGAQVRLEIGLVLSARKAPQSNMKELLRILLARLVRINEDIALGHPAPGTRRFASARGPTLVFAGSKTACCNWSASGTQRALALGK